jgi:hypothetical protein
VPAATAVITATGSKTPAPTVAGQQVNWTVALAAQETVTLTIAARAVSPGSVTNTATFSGPQLFTEEAHLWIYSSRVYLPVVLKR